MFKKVRGARLTRHSWCVRRTLQRKINFLNADWYSLLLQENYA
jgi:hypothetical protein